MLGERIRDPDGVESHMPGRPDVAGLGLLPVETIFAREKVTHPVRVQLGDGVPLLDAAGGRTLAGYEIHCGRVAMTSGAQGQGARPFARVVRRGDGVADEREGCIRGRVAGTLVHGLFENDLVRAVLGSDDEAATDPYDALADHFECALDMRHVDSLVGL
ncbi:MAG TPA: cobyric acid synthase CobQ, partial [Polyangia bacterium]|nr:cobyric acid synthase CobQ [Polyangia bacterium]